MFQSTLLIAALACGQQPMPLPTAAPGYPILVQGQPAPLPPAPAAAAPAANGNGTCDACEEKQDEKPKYFLEKVLEDTCLGQRGWKPYGWFQGSYTGSTARNRNLPITFNDMANEFLLNQVWIGASKEVDPSKKEFQLGGRAEIFYGSDARFTIPRGLFDYQVRNNELYPFDIYQFYTEAFLPGVGPDGTTVRVGRFATHCSYEVTQGPAAPFLSRSYLFQANPFTHTGVWAITPLTEDWTVSNGVAVGSDNFIDPTNRPTYIGQLQWKPKDGKTTVLFNTVLTDPRYDVDEAFLHYNVYNLQWIHQPCDRLTLAVDATYSHTYNVPGIGFAGWYGAAGYASYKLTSKLTSQLRTEVFNDPTGFRTGSEGLYTGVTGGLAYSPCDWLMIRPSVRYDYNGESAPFEGKRYLWTGVFETIIRW